MSALGLSWLALPEVPGTYYVSPQVVQGDQVTSLVLVVVGATGLFAIFRAVEFQWPENYHTLDNSSSADFAVSAGPLRYLLFRLLPSMIVAALVTTSAARLGLDWPVAHGAGAVLLHTAASNGRAAIAVWRRPLGSRRGPLILMQLFTAMLATLSGIAASALHSSYERMIPTVDELVTGIWTALFASVLAIVLMKATAVDYDATSLALRRSADSIPDALFEFAASEAAAVKLDPRILWTLMVVENLQRPKWFRFMERRLGFAFPARTTGILQVMSDAPLSDRESIRIVARQRLPGQTIPRTQHGYADSDALRGIFMMHNPSLAYGELCVEAFRVLDDYLDRRFLALIHELAMGEDG